MHECVHVSNKKKALPFCLVIHDGHENGNHDPVVLHIVFPQPLLSVNIERCHEPILMDNIVLYVRKLQIGL